MIQQLIDRYKRYRTEHFLAQKYQYSYAFVGMGQHSLTNLYPVLHYLGVPLKVERGRRVFPVSDKAFKPFHSRHLKMRPQREGVLCLSLSP